METSIAPGTPRTPRGSKAKPTGTHSGFRYEVGNPRKNGSEVWKCVDKDCKASVIKKEDNYSLTKEHTVGGATMQSTLQHISMTLLRERALAHPDDTPSQIIHHISTSVRDLVLATVPPASTLERLVTEWRENAQQKGKKKVRRPAGGSTPKNKGKTGESSRKRLKMTPKGKKGQDQESEDEEADFEKLEDELEAGDEAAEGEEESESSEDDEGEEEQLVPEKKKRPRKQLQSDSSEEQ